MWFLLLFFICFASATLHSSNDSYSSHFQQQQLIEEFSKHATDLSTNWNQQFQDAFVNYKNYENQLKEQVEQAKSQLEQLAESARDLREKILMLEQHSSLLKSSAERHLDSIRAGMNRNFEQFKAALRSKQKS